MLFQIKSNLKTYIVLFSGFFLSIFLLYTAGFGQFPLPVQRGLPLMLVSILVFLKFPLAKEGSLLRRYKHYFILETVLNILLIIGVVFSTYYIIINSEEIALRLGSTTSMDLFVTVVGIITVLEITRRTAPPALFYIGLIALAYALLGEHIPGRFGHVGFSISRIAQYMYFSYEGIFGVALGVMVDIVFLFIFLGVFLEATGTGKALINIAYAITGRIRGGPAQAAVLSSSLLGTVSGSSVANVVGSGTFTIPLMKKTGFKGTYAGGVEAVASTGGMIMPPVMGAAAFLMAEILGVPYLEIITMALIPALLYYICLFITIYLRASKQNLKGLPKSELPSIKEVLKINWSLFLPLIFLVILLVLGYTPSFAAFYSIVLLFILSFVRKKTRLPIKEYFSSISRAAESSLSIFSSLAYVGIIIGVISLTGLGIKFSVTVTSLSGDSLLFALLLIMLACLILGMGLPPVACYVILISISGQAIESLGVATPVVHMFIFYFGALASITPPVAMASFAASAISGADEMKTSWVALRLGIVGFIIPYMFVFGPELLMIGSAQEIILAIISALVGVFSLAVGIEGYLVKKVSLLLRGLFIIGALLLLNTEILTDIIGYILIFLLISYQIFIIGNFSLRKSISTKEQNVR